MAAKIDEGRKTFQDLQSAMTSITEIRNTLHQMQKRELLQHGEYKGKS